MESSGHHEHAGSIVKLRGRVISWLKVNGAGVAACAGVRLAKEGLGSAAGDLEEPECEPDR